jgi:DNA-binding XRE family transcriptional regulator
MIDNWHLDNLHYKIIYSRNWTIMSSIMEINEVLHTLRELGARLRAARLERNDTMAVFAERLGVSPGTVRAMEHGAPTVQIGIWLNALWMLNQLDAMSYVLEPRESVLDRIRAREKGSRQRASRRPR